MSTKNSEVNRQEKIYKKAKESEILNNAKTTEGKVILTTPVHLTDKDIQVVNPEDPENERVIRISNSRREYRQFDGGYHRHCSKCPFPEGCIMCCLK
ncbi:hypothetical protein COB64_02385 [Candidatus Wolfebacteria bacterium]|nr:MAG: hypothetical protein COB64_02385 [Candidatus Wolfebacteria bacterium]